MGFLTRKLLGISDHEVLFTIRGFQGVGEPAHQNLEESGRAFVAGYMAALEDEGVERLAERLDRHEREFRGFAYEGAAMALYLLDLLPPWTRKRLDPFLRGPCHSYRYLAHVGVGWAMARVPIVSLQAILGRFEPHLVWLAVDGYGFHEAFFHTERTVREQRIPRRLRSNAYACRAFDQGVGRSLWFIEGAGPERIAQTIGSFPASRRADLWSGVGLACAYAGGVPESHVERLLELARDHLAPFAQGVAFAAVARISPGNPTPHTDLVCRRVWGKSAQEAHAMTEALGLDLPNDRPESSYEEWRCRIQRRYMEERSDLCKEEVAFSVATA